MVLRGRDGGGGGGGGVGVGVGVGEGERGEDGGGNNKRGEDGSCWWSWSGICVSILGAQEALRDCLFVGVVGAVVFVFAAAAAAAAAAFASMVLREKLSMEMGIFGKGEIGGDNAAVVIRGL